jgi:hypothetical protein
MTTKHFKKTITPPVRKSRSKAKARQSHENTKWHNIYAKRPPKPKKEKILKPLPKKHYVGKNKKGKPIHIPESYSYKDLYISYKQGADLYKVLKLVPPKAKSQLHKAAAVFIGGTLLGAAAAGIADKIFDDDAIEFNKELFILTHDNEDGFLTKLKDLIFGEKDNKKDTTLEDVVKEPEVKQSYSPEIQSTSRQIEEDITTIPPDQIEVEKITNGLYDNMY